MAKYIKFIMETIEPKSVEKQDTKYTDKRFIIVYNDDVNSFEWVIQSLIEVCEHEFTQAEQCAMIIHNNGKCDVKSGSYSELEPLATELLNRQLSAKIE